jgi:hypothetical protein
MKRRFSDWRNYCCLLYRTEYKYSGFATGKFGKYEGDSGNRVWVILEIAGLKISLIFLIQKSIHSLNYLRRQIRRIQPFFSDPTKIHQTYRLTIYITLILLCDPVTGFSNALPSQP